MMSLQSPFMVKCLFYNPQLHSGDKVSLQETSNSFFTSLQIQGQHL